MKRYVFGATVMVIGTTLAFAMGILNLPLDPVTVAHGPWEGGANSTLDITLSDVPPGFDVEDGTYTGWCAEDNFQPDLGAGEQAFLLDSTDADPLVCDPWGYPDVPWDKVNYLLNHKLGDKFEIQAALWIVAGTNHPTSPTYDETTANVVAMVADANANGDGFIPGPGDVTAVIICVDGLDDGDPYLQDTLIEVWITNGCTPGYWKQTQHFDSWPRGVDPRDSFAATFGVRPTRDLALGRALRLGGGGEKALMRHATAAYLNALHRGVDYGYSLAEVIRIVRWAYDTGRFEDAKNMLEAYNEEGCPLN